jgi:hypothetical protein
MVEPVCEVLTPAGCRLVSEGPASAVGVKVPHNYGGGKIVQIMSW